MLHRARLKREKHMLHTEQLARAELDALFEEHAATAPAALPVDVQGFTAHEPWSGTLMSSSSATIAIAALRQLYEEPAPEVPRSKSVPRARAQADVAASRRTAFETSEERKQRVALDRNYELCRRQGITERQEDLDAR